VFRGRTAETVRRANRALRFLDQFPALLTARPPALVPAVGSSGTMWAVEAAVAARALADLGVDATVVNIGLPAISPRGFVQISQYLRDTIGAGGLPVPGILVELDPMLLSTKPPRGDVRFDPDQLRPRTAPMGDPAPGQLLGWSAAHFGT
jgi:hypothetical protein